MENSKLEKIFKEQIVEYNLPLETQKELMEISKKAYNYYAALGNIEETSLQTAKLFLEYACICRQNK